MAMERRIRTSPELRREQIINEAVLLIGERGYYGFGIKELAQRCGLGNAGLLHHFGSKERLLIAVLEARDRSDFAAATNFLRLSGVRYDAGRLGLAAFRDVLSATVEKNSREPELIRLFAVLQAEALNHTHPAHDYFLTREAAILNVFTSALAPYVERPLSVARQLLAQWLGLEQQWLRTDQGFDLVAEWRLVAQSAGLRADAAVTPLKS
jgi:AcrR family transcriptional regulator